MTDHQDVPFVEDLLGLDFARPSDFLLSECRVRVAGPLRGRVLAGGKSNYTYEATDGESSWVVRRPPLGRVLPTAHDVSREYRMLTALQPTLVPVPATFALCEDRDVLGAPFFVMERIEGRAFRRSVELADLGAARTAQLSVHMVHTLADLHDVDPDAVGLAAFRRPQGSLARQVRRWESQLAASRSRDRDGADRLSGLLAANVPPDGPASIVHGDYRLDNLLVEDTDRVAAVIDWEMATIGDPMTDVALLCVHQRLPGLPGGSAIFDASMAPGLFEPDEMLKVYGARSSRDTSRIAFYLGLAYYKLAVVLEGVHKRHLDGQALGDGFDTVGLAVEPLNQEGLYTMWEFRGWISHTTRRPANSWDA